MKTLLFKALTVAAAATLIIGCDNAAKKKNNGQAEQAEEAEQAKQAPQITKPGQINEKQAMEIMKDLPEEPEFDIVTNLGTITVKLYSKTPKHRDNFEKLALTGYFNGLLFHRVIDGFMIQGGDPNTRDTSPEGMAKYGQGGPGYTIPAEFIPEYNHKKGALAAARKGDVANPMKESSGSQFYLVQDAANCAQLDGAYTVFGETVKGLDVIDKIAKVETDNRDRPVNPVKIEAVKAAGETAEIVAAALSK